MEQQNEFLLTDYLDNLLAGNELLAAEEILRTDKKAGEEMQYMKLAVEAVQYAAIYDRVTSIRSEFSASSVIVSNPPVSIVRSLYRNTMRAAAIIISLVAVAALYKYTSVNADKTYSQQYASYELNTSRGINTEKKDPVEEAYRSKNWNEVITQFNITAHKTNKSWFLAGMAEMELKQYPTAISSFNEVIKANSKSGDAYFQDEAEYYLAMAYLANHESAKAIVLIDKIKQDKNHLYYPLTSQISATDLKIIELKSGK